MSDVPLPPQQRPPEPTPASPPATPSMGEPTQPSRAEPRPDTAALAADLIARAGTAASTPEVAFVSAESALPGEHRGGFARLPTEPVGIAAPWAPPDAGGSVAEPVPQWLVTPPPRARRGVAGWALAASVLGLVVSLFVGWGFPIGIVGIVAAILALRSPRESRGVAVWALALGTLSIVYSAGWLFFAARSASLCG